MKSELFCKRIDEKEHNINLLLKRCLFTLNLIIFKTFGLAPWKINNLLIFETNSNNNNKVYPFEVSTCGIVYGVLLIIITLIYGTVTCIFQQWNQNYFDLVVTNIVDSCLITFGIIVLIIVWTNYFLQQKTAVDVFNGLYNINKSLQNCKVYHLETDFWFYIICIGNFTMCFVIFTVEWFVIPKFAVPLWFVPLSISSCVLIHYTLLLNIIIQLLKSANKTILTLGNINIKTIETPVLSKVLLQESVISDIITISCANVKLCEICRKIVDFYAIPTLCIIIYYVTSTTYHLYFTILYLIIKNDSFVIVLDGVLWVLFIIFTCVALTTNVTRITREVMYLNIYTIKICVF